MQHIEMAPLRHRGLSSDAINTRRFHHPTVSQVVLEINELDVIRK
jgi:hypothetical protein